jgi:hypothetical protein
VTQRAEMIDRAIQHSECPKCGAPPGEQCRDDKRLGITHGERLHAPRQDTGQTEKKGYHRNKGWMQS